MAFIKTNASKDTCQLWQKRPCSPASRGQADPAVAVGFTSHCASHVSWSCRHWLRACGLVNRQEPHAQTTESFVIMSLAYKSMKWPFHGVGSIKVSWKIGKVHWHRASTDSFIPKKKKATSHTTKLKICVPLNSTALYPSTSCWQKQVKMHNHAAASITKPRSCVPPVYSWTTHCGPNVPVRLWIWLTEMLPKLPSPSPRFPSSPASTYSPTSLDACWLSFSATGDSEIAATFKEFLMELSSQMCKLMMCTPQQWLASLYKFLRTAFRSRI